MLKANGGRVVVISMNTETMTRPGFVPYGPSGAAVEALAHVMAADLMGTSGNSTSCSPAAPALPA
jgi:gluconate 5-dehydrogenase